MGRGGRAARRLAAAGVIGLIVAVVVMVRALHVDGVAAPDAELSPATLEEITARTVAALRARYAAEVRLEVAGGQVVVVRQEGAVDRPAARAWSETSWRRPATRGGDAAEVVERVRITDGWLYLQPGLAAPSVGLHPGAWLAAPLDEAQAPHLVDELARSLGGLGDELTALTSPAGPVVVQRVGRERLHGTPTTHLTVARPGDADVDVDAVDVWVDRHHRLRRLDIAPGRTVTARLEMFAYGEPVTVARPDAARASANGLTVLRSALAGLAEGVWP